MPDGAEGCCHATDATQPSETGSDAGLAPPGGNVWPARGDLIRPKTLRSYPDIAGDIVGSQTYTFDPGSRTGTFQVRNSPQFIALGPDGGEMVSVTPNQDGTLSQTLRLTLDQKGKLVPGTNNRFQLYGTVVIGDKVYEGLLLEGTPTAFGAQEQNRRSLKPGDVFDLNMKITGGRLASAFGSEAYFRVIPQSNSTFQGSFATSFSGDKPLTNLRALKRAGPSVLPEPSALVLLLTAGARDAGETTLEANPGKPTVELPRRERGEQDSEPALKREERGPCRAN